MPFVDPMKPPNMKPPEQTNTCMCCDQEFLDGAPAALIRSYATKPGQPKWSWWWVCSECLVEQAPYADCR